MAGQKRRTGKTEQVPQRVENAAQYMHASSAGPRRGFVPQMPNMQANVRQGQPQIPERQNTANQAPLYPYQPQDYSFQQQMTGAQRGYRIPTATVQATKPKKKNHALLIVLALLLIAGLGTGGYFAADSYNRTKTINDKVTPYDELFCPGVYVDGISLGGMTPSQAMNSVQSQIQQRHDAWSVQLVYNQETVARIDADMLGLNVDPTQVMNEAWQQGHTGDAEQRYEQMLRLEQEPYTAYTAKPDGNTQAIDNTLAQLKNQIDKPATDAVMERFDPNEDYPFIMTDETFGYQLNTEPIKQQLYQMLSTLESGVVEIKPERIEPNLRKADLMKHYMLRSSVYTNIDRHSSENRNKNIQRAFDFINGYVLNPGATFSFNGVVGERTEARGFLPAIEYVYGEHVEGYGGGVCQASTTLYQAAVCAGMKILKREPHSDSVSYTDYGKDATVYWVGKRKIDFSFSNNTDDPIYIVAAVQQDPSNRKRQIAKVSIYGQDMGDMRYELESEVIETLPAPFEPEYIKDTNGTYVTYKDQQESVSKAKEGYVVNSYRIAYVGSTPTEKKLLYTDTYSPKAERIYVGVKSR